MFALMSGRMIFDGGTRRMRMPTSVMMLTRTSAASAEIHSPSGTKCRKIMMAAMMRTRKKPEPNNDSICNSFRKKQCIHESQKPLPQGEVPSDSEAERVACSFDEHASILTSPVRAGTPNVSCAHPRRVQPYEFI